MSQNATLLLEAIEGEFTPVRLDPWHRIFCEAVLADSFEPNDTEATAPFVLAELLCRCLVEHPECT